MLKKTNLEDTKRVVAVMFVGDQSPVMMELDNLELYELKTAKTDRRFVKLEGAYHNLDRIQTFWEIGMEAEIG